MIWVISGVFVLLTFLNRRDSVKFRTSLSFAVIHLLNTVISFYGIAFYYSAIGSSIILLLYPLMSSQRNWVILLAIILTLCISVNLLGIINYELWNIKAISSFIDVSNYMTTVLEMIVLASVVNGNFNGYYTDTIKRMGQHSVWGVPTRINYKLYISKIIKR